MRILVFAPDNEVFLLVALRRVAQRAQGQKCRAKELRRLRHVVIMAGLGLASKWEHLVRDCPGQVSDCPVVPPNQSPRLLFVMMSNTIVYLESYAHGLG